jgi:hypothetical protein
MMKNESIFYPLLEKVEQKIKTTFRKSGAKTLAPPFIKVEKVEKVDFLIILLLPLIFVFP